MLKLRDYQADGDFKINQAWKAVKNVLYVLPTGGGKTVLFAHILHQHNGPSCAIAHRQELVSQISIALAKFGVSHRIIASKKLVHNIVKMHVDKTGRSYYNPAAPVAVAGIDTLLRRTDTLSGWMKTVTLWVTDEAHHVLKENKWGSGCELFPNAKGLGVTATPVRADGAGLGRHADGLFDEMIIGPSMHQLINQGYLTDYRLFAPPSDLDLDGIKISDKTGEYSPNQLKQRAAKSHIVGDVVKHYLRIAPGKLGITFAIDVEEATKIANAFNDAGVPAAIISAKTPDTQRIKLLEQFERREILQLVNVDLFGEGFDLPALEVVSMARPTHSYALYAQQFGRVLRLMIDNPHLFDMNTVQGRLAAIDNSNKTRGIVIDHVGNLARHGLPDREIPWTLDRREKASRRKRDEDEIPLKTCKNPACNGVYEAIYKICPYCGTVDVPTQRSAPEYVDGDLLELDPAMLAALRGEISEIDKPAKPPKPGDVVHNSIQKNHRLRQEAQDRLRRVIAWVGGYYKSLGADSSESMKRFYFRFKVDTLSACTLKTKEADDLTFKMINYLYSVGVIVVDDIVNKWYAERVMSKVG